MASGKLEFEACKRIKRQNTALEPEKMKISIAIRGSVV